MFTSSSPLRSLPLWVRVTGSAVLCVAVFLAGLAVGIPQHGAQFLPLYPVVFACVYYAGRDAGIAATIAGVIAVSAYLALHPQLRVDVELAITSLFLFLIAGIGFSVIVSELKRALRKVEAANAELKMAHAAAVAAEEEADLLLNELTHRVRNDLSNVISILRMQARSLDEAAAAPLQSAVDRLQVLAKLHRKLSRQGSSPVVDMKDFLHEICGHFRATTLPLRPVGLESDVEPIKLSSSRALAVGLIANELLTNAVKYAYPQERAGTIRLSLSTKGEQARLAVDDDGVGFTPGEEPPVDGSGLGQRLVRSLAAQLGGEFLCETGAGGTSCRVNFPLEGAS